FHLTGPSTVGSHLCLAPALRVPLLAASAGAALMARYVLRQFLDGYQLGRGLQCRVQRRGHTIVAQVEYPSGEPAGIQPVDITGVGGRYPIIVIAIGGQPGLGAVETGNEIAVFQGSK